MVISRVLVGILAAVAVLLSVSFPATHAQASARAPAPAPTSDGTSIDQGIAYVLMLVALVLTYLIHVADISCSF